MSIISWRKYFSSYKIMNTFSALFQAFGFSQEESNIYLVCLNIGSNPVSIIAKNANIKRQTCLYTVKKLESKWSISSYVKNGVTYYSAITPEELIKQQKEKMQQIEDALPEILSIMYREAVAPKVRYYQNEGVSLVTNEILKHNKVAVFTNLDRAIENHLQELKNFRNNRKDWWTHSRILTYQSEQVMDFFTKEWIPSGDEYRFLKKGDFEIENDIVITDTSVYILSMCNTEKYALVIESASFARAQKSVFELLWSHVSVKM